MSISMVRVVVNIVSIGGLAALVATGSPWWVCVLAAIVIVPIQLFVDNKAKRTAEDAKEREAIERTGESRA
ncbi:hypothetical protein [Arthrobacter sp. Z1-15]